MYSTEAQIDEDVSKITHLLRGDASSNQENYFQRNMMYLI